MDQKTSKITGWSLLTLILLTVVFVLPKTCNKTGIPSKYDDLGIYQDSISNIRAQLHISRDSIKKIRDYFVERLRVNGTENDDLKRLLKAKKIETIYVAEIKYVDTGSVKINTEYVDTSTNKPVYHYVWDENWTAGEIYAGPNAMAKKITFVDSLIVTSFSEKQKGVLNWFKKPVPVVQWNSMNPFVSQLNTSAYRAEYPGSPVLEFGFHIGYGVNIPSFEPGFNVSGGVNLSIRELVSRWKKKS